jgi:pantoate--beta-alanine ligase
MTDLITTVQDMRTVSKDARQEHLAIGLVPTMGALHAGHGALIDQARRESQVLAVSIFVNPIQFDRREDFERYVRNMPQDLAFCSDHKVDLVFAPTVEEMYPAPQKTFIEVSGVSDKLCGEFRPGHFRGVATVVAKLLNIVQPSKAYFGEKDAQQLAVIKTMVVDLNLPVSIVPVPTVREPDGLALSSRNSRLGPEDRKVAPLLYQALQAACVQAKAGSRHAQDVKGAGRAVLAREPRIRTEYFEVVNKADMQPVENINGPVLVAAAIWLGGTRLIDNVSIDGPLNAVS